MIPFSFNPLGISNKYGNDLSVSVSFYIADHNEINKYLKPEYIQLKYEDESDYRDIKYQYNTSSKQVTINVLSSKMFTIATSADGYLSGATNAYYNTLRKIFLNEMSDDEDPWKNKGVVEGTWTANEDLDTHILVYKRSDISAETELSTCTPISHVYYSNKTYTANGKTIAKLDADVTKATDGSASETMTLSALDEYDFVLSFIKYSGSIEIKNSGLAVAFTLEGVPYGPYKASDATGNSGDWWYVCEVRNKQVIVKNFNSSSTIYKGLSKS